MSISQMLPEALAAKYREYLKPFEGHTQALLDSRIVEMGSNSNGTYVRWANGLQVCMAKVEVDFTSTGFQNFSYPASFEGTPFSGSFVAISRSFGSGEAERFALSTLRVSSSQWNFRVNETFSSDDWPTGLFAIGWWK